MRHCQPRHRMHEAEAASTASPTTNSTRPIQGSSRRRFRNPMVLRPSPCAAARDDAQLKVADLVMYTLC